MRVSLAGAILLAAFLIYAGPAEAASCSSSASGSFAGNYDPTSPTTLTGSLRVDIYCDTAWTDITVGASTGSGTYANRNLRNGLNVMRYNIYTREPASGGIVLGDGYSSGTGLISATTSSSGTISVVAPMQIPALQNLPPGTYTDTIVVTVTF